MQRILLILFYLLFGCVSYWNETGAPMTHSTIVEWIFHVSLKGIWVSKTPFSTDFWEHLKRYPTNVDLGLFHFIQKLEKLKKLHFVKSKSLSYEPKIKQCHHRRRIEAPYKSYIEKFERKLLQNASTYFDAWAHKERKFPSSLIEVNCLFDIKMQQKNDVRQKTCIRTFICWLG